MSKERDSLNPKHVIYCRRRSVSVKAQKFIEYIVRAGKVMAAKSVHCSNTQSFRKSLSFSSNHSVHILEILFDKTRSLSGQLLNFVKVYRFILLNLYILSRRNYIHFIRIFLRPFPGLFSQIFFSFTSYFLFYFLFISLSIYLSLYLI